MPDTPQLFDLQVFFLGLGALPAFGLAGWLLRLKKQDASLVDSLRSLMLLLAGGVALLLGGTATADQPVQHELRFDVRLDGKPIGTHDVRITDRGATRTVETRADLEVRILFVPVFSYRHSNTETWQDGCLERIDSETDSNGTPYRVNLDRIEQGYRVSTLNDAATYATACMMTFAYWDKRFVRQARLLNSQTGELMEVEVETLGTDRPEWLSVDAPLDGYRIRAEGENIDIRVFYHQGNSRWVALESLLDSGRVMRYVPSPNLQATGQAAPLSANRTEE